MSNRKLSDKELEKIAGVLGATFKSLKGLKNIKGTQTGKFFSKLTGGYKQKGFAGLLDEASKYKTPVATKGKNFRKKINLPKEQMGESTLARGFRSSIGNTADNLKTLTKGMGEGSVGKRMLQAGKNIKDTGANQLRGSQLVEKELRDLPKGSIINKNNKKYLSDSKFLPDREIMQDTGRGIVVKKRLPFRATAPLLTAPGFAATSYATQSITNKNKPESKKIKDSLIEGGRFIAGEGPGLASYLLF